MAPERQTRSGTDDTSAVIFAEIRYEVQDAIATITLNRPDRLNAITPTLAHEVIAAFDASDADDNVRVVIVTGAGRAFCAGADLSGGATTFEAGRAQGEVPRDFGGLLTLRIFDSLKPVIAAINGPAVGLGLTMTLPMDIRLAADGARLGFVFARRGLMPDGASSWFLPRVVGISQAAEWIYTGRVFPASEALAGGLVRGVYPAGELLPAAWALAREIADNTAPVAVAMARRLMWRMLGADHPARAHIADSRALVERGASGDVHEGVNAFLDKRPPVFPDTVSGDLIDIFGEPQPGWAADLFP